MHKACVSAVLAFALASAAHATVLAERGADDDDKVTIIGCAVKGDGDGDGFLLANAVERTTTTTTQPGAAGSVVSTDTTTAMKPSRVLYWLDDDDDKVKLHLGHQVEIVGELEGDIEEAKVEVERENDAVEIEIDADGRKAKVLLPDLPSAIGTSGDDDDDERELKYLVRKLDVKSVRMLAATCQ